MLVDWLSEQAELIPVTARGTEEISRVRIPSTPGNHHSRGRHSHARRQTRRGVEGPYARPAGSYQEKLTSMQRLITEMMDAKGSMPGKAELRIR